MIEVPVLIVGGGPVGLTASILLSHLLSSGGAWRAATAGSAIPLDTVVIGPDGDLTDPDGTWHPTYGIDAGSAVLVRPDGYVAWRCRASADPASELRRAVGAILGRA